ncbi:hypothetical protein FB567DRAFT_538637 [Paraphoma chrysanthemicola]|uniref:Uncharacterized protein n=1 Tax=Paraphoma chrysanthemicola TaxID=798071 RepID=A0A8K0QTS0_9PLEO|nr:hypothetical protein FB567DRAFT_538637 [Paraphoma chrysanthemicola]
MVAEPAPAQRPVLGFLFVVMLVSPMAFYIMENKYPDISGRSSEVESSVRPHVSVWEQTQRRRVHSRAKLNGYEVVHGKGILSCILGN